MRVNRVFTITAGTPIHLLTGLTVAADIQARMPHPVFIRNLRLQMGAGSTDYGILYDGVYPSNPQRLPVTTIAADFSADLAAQIPAPAVAGQPGIVIYLNNDSPVGNMPEDGRCKFIDGHHTGDTVIASWDQEETMR